MPKEVDREMAEAGSRFETEVRQAMREAGIGSIAELERRTRVKQRVIYDWFSGLHEPRASSLERLARPLNRTPEQLLARWEGQPGGRRQKTPANPWDAASAAVADAIDRQTEMLREILERLAPAFESPLPTADEAAAVEEAEAERDRQVVDTPRHAGRRNGAEE